MRARPAFFIGRRVGKGRALQHDGRWHDIHLAMSVRQRARG